MATKTIVGETDNVIWLDDYRPRAAAPIPQSAIGHDHCSASNERPEAPHELKPQDFADRKHAQLFQSSFGGELGETR